MMKRIFLMGVLFSGICSFTGCVRVAGSAGYWKTTGDDEKTEYHGAGFDTQQLAPQKGKGSITIAG